MSAKDYEIRTGIFKEYLSKVSERDLNLMLDDRRHREHRKPIYNFKAK